MVLRSNDGLDVRSNVELGSYKDARNILKVVLVKNFKQKFQEKMYIAGSFGLVTAIRSQPLVHVRSPHVPTQTSTGSYFHSLPK